MKPPRAKEILSAHDADVIFYFNETLKLWMVVIFGAIIYINPKDLEEFDEPLFKTLIGQALMRYVATNPRVMFH